MIKEKSSDFVKFGSFSAEEADILKPELEKIGIPVKVFYPGTNIGKEYTAGARWTAYTLMIPIKDFNRASKVCNKLNIKARHIIPLPKLLYTRTNRYILGIVVFLYLAIIIFGQTGLIENTSILTIVVTAIFLGWILLFVVNAYKVIKNKDN
jgi:hypothetical protein